MPAWWNSIDAVTSMNIVARWAAGILAIAAALCGLLVLASGLKLDKLKALRDKQTEERQKHRRLIRRAAFRNKEGARREAERQNRSYFQ
jgi:hypothetical protein